MPPAWFARLLTLVATLSPLAPALAAAQSADRRAPLVVELPGSTRGMAMGDAYVALSDADALFYNPAQLVPARGVNLAAQRYGSASTLGTLSAAMAGGNGTIAAGVQFLDSGSPCPGCAAAIPTREGELLTEGEWRSSSFAATVAYARPVFGVRVGVAAKYVEQRIPADRDGTIAADIGAAMDVGRFWVGASARNLGPAIALAGERWRLPQRYTVGVAGEGFLVGPVDVAASAALWADADGDVTPALGVEGGWTPLEGYTVLGRAGVRVVHGDGGEPITLGAALVADRLQVEYAWRAFDGVGDAHRVGLRWRAGG